MNDDDKCGSPTCKGTRGNHPYLHHFVEPAPQARAIDMAAYNARTAAEVAARTLAQEAWRAFHNDRQGLQRDQFARSVEPRLMDAIAAGRAAELNGCVAWVREAEGDGVASDLFAARRGSEDTAPYHSAEHFKLALTWIEKHHPGGIQLVARALCETGHVT